MSYFYCVSVSDGLGAVFSFGLGLSTGRENLLIPLPPLRRVACPCLLTGQSCFQVQGLASPFLFKVYFMRSFDLTSVCFGAESPRKSFKLSGGLIE